MRRLPAALALALALAACGSDTIEPASDDADDTRSTAAPAASEIAELVPPRPVTVSPQGGSGVGLGEFATSSAAAASDAIPVDPGIGGPVPHWVHEYVVADDLPSLPAIDTGFVFEPNAVPSPQQIADLAVAFGLEGEPQRVEHDGGATWWVGPEDGSAPSLHVTEDAQLTWGYSSAWAADESSEAPDGVPGEGEATELARNLMDSLGEDPAGYDFEVSADEWLASVTVSGADPQVRGGRTWSLGFGADGAAMWAASHLAEPAVAGPYPLVDLATALVRLNEGIFGFGGGIVALPGVAEPAVGVETDAATSGLAPDTVESLPIASLPDDPVDDEPIPVEAPAEPVVVTLVDVQPDLWWAWDEDGSVWQLPAYRFIDTDGGWHVVPAVNDEFLVIAEQPIAVDEPITPDEVAPPIAEPAALDELVGFSIEEFTSEAAALGYTTRVVMQDGEALVVTEDFSDARVNVVVEGPRVVAIESIG